MDTTTQHPANRAFAAIATTAVSHAVLVVLLSIILAAGALFYAVKTIQVDTDTSKMLSLELDYRQPFFALNKTFPQLDNLILIIVDAQDTGVGRETVGELVDALNERPDMLTNIFAPQASTFFRRYGVLYQSPAEVEKLSEEILNAEPAIDLLNKNPNFLGLAQLVENIENGAKAGIDISASQKLFAAASQVVEDRNAGQPEPMNWLSLGQDDSKTEPARFYIALQPKLDYSRPDPFAIPLELVREIVARPEFSGREGVNIALTGEVTISAEELETVSKGAAISGIGSLVIVTLVIIFGMPVVRLIVPALALLILGFLITAGLAALSVGSLNLISVAFPVLFVGLGIDYAVHVILRFLEYFRTGLSRRRAAIEAVAHTGPALGVCTLTTTMAFLSFVPTDFVGMAQLGIISAGGILVAMIGSVTLIPAILVLIPLSDKHRKADAGLASWRFLRVLYGRSRLAMTGLTLVLCIAGLFYLPQLRFDGDPINLKAEAAPSVVAFKQLLRDEPEQAYAAQLVVDNAAEAERLIPLLTALPVVDKVVRLNSFLPQQQQEKIEQLQRFSFISLPEEGLPGDIGDDARWANVAGIMARLERITALEIDSNAKAAMQRFQQALKAFQPGNGDAENLKALENDLFGGFPQTIQTLSALGQLKSIGIDDLDEDIRARFKAQNGKERLQIVPAKDLNEETNLVEFAEALREVSAKATGTPVEIVGAARTIAAAMLLAVLLAGILVTLILLMILRRLSDTILALLPIALAGVLLAAYTVLAGTPFNFANVIVLPLLLGLGIDASVHYVMRAREGGKAGEVADTSTPRAILIAALTTIGSFGTLWASQHNGTASMGELLTVALLFSLVTTLVVLPQLLDWRAKWVSRSR